MALRGKPSLRKKQVSPLRVVFSQEKKFICGMCRQVYVSRAEAKACINDCVNEVAKINPVKVVRSSLGVEHQCQICKRIYSEHNSAQACAKDCAASQKKKLSLEAQIMGSVASLPANRKKFKRTKLAQAQLKAIPKYNLKRKTEEDLKNIAATDAVSQAQAAVEIPPAAVMPTQEVKVPEVKEGIKKDPNKKFVRDGAEYVCSVCAARFYTKVEVTACWEKH